MMCKKKKKKLWESLRIFNMKIHILLVWHSTFCVWLHGCLKKTKMLTDLLSEAASWFRQQGLVATCLTWKGGEVDEMFKLGVRTHVSKMMLFKIHERPIRLSAASVTGPWKLQRSGMRSFHELLSCLIWLHHALKWWSMRGQYHGSEILHTYPES